ncbi:alkane 1-monooxygenase [Gordonia paraffinivorans]|uniref:alkane 1-monooxygenase n=1 Tax=Gordonia paraffinivorans TaxID=175628 RepID=UPI0013EF6F49|nr:alkane 1-monooxygenase [Gordonia paraffinivorans]
MGYLLVQLTTLGIFWATGLIVMLVVLPILDLVIGKQSWNPPEEIFAELQERKFYRWCTYAYLPAQLASFVFGAWCIATQPMGPPEYLAMSSTVGIAVGVGIGAAHELTHQNNRTEQVIGYLILMQAGYAHFALQHTHFHHRLVATPADCSSARFGESLWRFLPRSIIGSVKNSFSVERRRLAGNPSVLRRILHNRIIVCGLGTVALFGATIAVFGWSLLPYCLLQAAIGILILEAANYIEHYGLLRGRRLDGRFRPCLPEDSWNSDHLVSNVFLFKVQRHSDHHAHPKRRYQCLRTFDDVPQLPAGYSVMMLTSLVPRLWRRVMDERLLVGSLSGHICSVNMYEPHRAKSVAKYRNHLNTTCDACHEIIGSENTPVLAHALDRRAAG